MSSSKMPKCVVVGCGNWGKNLVRALASLNALGGVVERNETQALELSKTYHVPVFEFEEALKNSHIDGIMIATASEDRALLAHQAFSHKKHVFLEKPVAFTRKEAAFLYEKALESNCFIMAGHLLLHHPVFKKMLIMIQEGMIGDIRFIQTQRKNFGKFFKIEDALWDFGPHDLSMVWALLRNEKNKHLQKTNTHVLYERQGLSEVFEGTLVFENVSVHMSFSRLSPYKEQRITVVGNKGMLSFDDTKPWSEKLLYIPLSFSEEEANTPLRGDEKFIYVTQEEPLKNECLAFLNAFQKEEKPKSFLEAIEVTGLVEQLQKSIKP